SAAVLGARRVRTPVRYRPAPRHRTHTEQNPYQRLRHFIKTYHAKCINEVALYHAIVVEHVASPWGADPVFRSIASDQHAYCRSEHIECRRGAGGLSQSAIRMERGASRSGSRRVRALSEIRTKRAASPVQLRAVEPSGVGQAPSAERTERTERTERSRAARREAAEV